MALGAGSPTAHCLGLPNAEDCSKIAPKFKNQKCTLIPKLSSSMHCRGHWSALLACQTLPKARRTQSKGSHSATVAAMPSGQSPTSGLFPSNSYLQSYLQTHFKHLQLQIRTLGTSVNIRLECECDNACDIHAFFVAIEAFCELSSFVSLCRSFFCWQI